MQTCATCRFWAGQQPAPGEFKPTLVTGNGPGAQPSMGECRLNPPMINLIAADSLQPGRQNLQKLCVWPATTSAQWCGQHKPVSDDVPESS